MREVQVLGVHVDVGTGSTVVLLGEDSEALRVLPIFIGPTEAQAIVIGIEGIELPRPGTHDLVTRLLDRLQARVTSMVITELQDNVFHAELGVEAAAGTFELSIRPSDGIAIAVRAGVPIHVVPDVLEHAGVELTRVPETPFSDEEVNAIVSEFRDALATATPEDFNRLSDDGPDAADHDPEQKQDGD